MSAGTRARVRRLARRLGFDVMRYDPTPPAFAFRARLLAELGIDLVVDVGACFGDYGLGLRGAGYAGRIVSFEPLSVAYQRLEEATSSDRLWTSHRLALGAEPGEAELHVAANLASSSLLEVHPRSEEAEPASSSGSVEQVRVETLDRVRGDALGPPGPTWLKLDVQGLELEVLRGAAEVLRAVQVLDVELSTVELYRGQPLLGEVLAELSSRDFGLHRLEPIWIDPHTGEILQFDGIFVQRDTG